MKKISVRIMCVILAVLTVLTVNTINTGTAQAAELKDMETVKYDGYDIIISDDMFRHKSMEYDSTLAVLSVMMTHFSMPLHSPENKNDTDWYKNQPNRLKGFFDAIKFENFDTNEDYVSKSGLDTIGVGAASKKVDDYTVIAIVPRSGGYYREWANNVILGDGSKSDYMHEGWYNAANKLLDYLDEYIVKYKIKGKIKLWISGFSRGGATANIAAALLDNKIGQDVYRFSNGASIIHKDLYAYTFEAPQGANVNSKTVRKPKENMYNNIFNIVHPDDLVPKVAMKQYGFTRFGKDYYIRTKFYDPENYDTDIKVVKAFYKKYNPKNEFKADKLEMYGIPGEKIALAMTGLGGIGIEMLSSYINDKTPFLEKDKRKTNYDANIVETLLVEEMCGDMGGRDTYVKNYQRDVSDLLYYYMTEQKQEQSDAMEDLITGLMLAALLKSTGAPSSAVDDLIAASVSGTAATSSKLVSSMSTLLSKIAEDKPNEMLTTAKYISNIFQNHEPELIIAFMQAQDPNYVRAYNKENGTDFRFVSKMDNCDFIRGEYDGYNDIAVFDLEKTDDHPLPDKNGKDFKVLLNIDGTMLGRSDVTRTTPGYAAGYYSYITTEKMELFLPADGYYRITVKGYSKKPKHTVSYRVSLERFTLINNSPDFKQTIRKYEETCNLNTKKVGLDIYFGSAVDW